MFLMVFIELCNYDCHQVEHFHHPEKKPFALEPPASGNHQSTSRLYRVAYSEYFIYRESHGVWSFVTSFFHFLFSGFICVTASISASLFFYCQTVLHCGPKPLFVHHFMHLWVVSHFMAINAALNVHLIIVWASVLISLPSDFILGVDWVDFTLSQPFPRGVLSVLLISLPLA